MRLYSLKFLTIPLSARPPNAHLTHQTPVPGEGTNGIGGITSIIHQLGPQYPSYHACMIYQARCSWARSTSSGVSVGSNPEEGGGGGGGTYPKAGVLFASSTGLNLRSTLRSWLY